MIPPTSNVEARDTHRLIPSRYVEEPSVLTRIADGDEHLGDIFELDGATSGRLLSQEDRAPGIGRDELVFHISNYTIINAAFTYAHPEGGRFNTSDRGAWYAGFSIETAKAEVAFHRSRYYLEINWEKQDEARYQSFLADFTAEFHDCRGEGFEDVLAPDSYSASQALAIQLLHDESAGIVFPSVRHQGGTCLACFRPALVNNVRRGPSLQAGWGGTELGIAWKDHQS